MYSRNRRYQRGMDGSDRTMEYMTRTADEPDEELYSYNLPARYDGSRFSSYRRQEIPQERVIELPQESHEDECEKEIFEEKAEICCDEHPREVLKSFLDSVGSEELLIISIILMIAGSEDSGDLLVFLILLLIHG